MNLQIDWPMRDRAAGGVISKVVIPFPILRRTDGTRDEAATAVWAYIAEQFIHAKSAERALKGTDSCLK